MARNILILGNAGAARECYWGLREVMERDATLRFKGFLAFEGHPENLRDLASLQLENDESYRLEPGDEIILGLGEAGLRRRAFAKWKTRGARFMNLIFPTCSISGELDMGEANIIGYASGISNNVRMGNGNFLNGRVLFGHDVSIGDFNFFGPDSIVLGQASLGSLNTVGVRSVIMPKARLGDGNTVVPGSFVYKGCKDNQMLMGNPALPVT